jgi:tetratricopeptide (TPR) repeat protein
MEPRAGRKASAVAARALVAVSLLAWVTPTAWAEPQSEVEESLAARAYFVQELDHGWDQLIGDLVATIDARPEAARTSRMFSLRDNAWLTRGKALLQREDDDARHEMKAKGYLDALRSDGRGPELVQAATDQLVNLWVRWGERAEAKGEIERALTSYKSALDLNKADRRPYARIGELSRKQAEKLESEDRFDEALAELDESHRLILDGIGSDDASARSLKEFMDRIHDATGPLRFRWLGTKQALSAVRGEAIDYTSAVLSFSGDVKMRPVTVVPGSEVRVRRGTFTVSAAGTGGDPLTVTLTVDASGGDVVLPTLQPVSMVYVPAKPGLDAFLIDRTEVPNADFRPFAEEAGVAFTDGADDLPARGMTHALAMRYAKWAGKQLPIKVQWARAAFEDADGNQRTYPWGMRAGTAGTHLVAGKMDVQPVTACADGASFFGLLNAAGNVQEWLEPGWAIGGTHNSPTQLKGPVAAESGFRAWRQIDLLRDPIPSVEAFDAGRVPKDREDYKPGLRIDASKLDSVGVRCVVPLGTPREMP